MTPLRNCVFILFPPYLYYSTVPCIAQYLSPLNTLQILVAIFVLFGKNKTKKGYVEIFHTALLHRYVVKFHSVIRMGETI